MRLTKYCIDISMDSLYEDDVSVAGEYLRIKAKQLDKPSPLA